MTGTYMIGIDQSTQGTKALLFDEKGALVRREDIPHHQIVNDMGWVSHDGEEIYTNTISVVERLIENSGIDRRLVAGVGISNQRETSLVWDRKTGSPLGDAIVWQCVRAAEICDRIEAMGMEETIRKKTGLKLSPYFPASKLAWFLENIEGAGERARAHELCFGTMDTWLIYRLTKKQSYKTDYSNASRTFSYF